MSASSSATNDSVVAVPNVVDSEWVGLKVRQESRPVAKPSLSLLSGHIARNSTSSYSACITQLCPIRCPWFRGMHATLRATLR